MDLETKIKLSKQVMLISGIFCLMVAVLLLANFYQLKRSDPLESETMEVLVERLSEEPNNEELKEEIRNFDLLVRKAYFTASWQVRTGAILMLIGGVIFVIAFKINTDSRHKIDPPVQEREPALKAQLISSRWLLVTGSLLVVLAITAAWLSADHLSTYLPEKTASLPPGTEPEQIEIISIQDTSAREDTDSVSQDQEDVAEEDVAGEMEDTEDAEAEQAGSEPAIRFYGLEAFKENQATFRGYLGHGISYHENIPTQWDGGSGENVKWKVALKKPGYNSPVIWGDRIFIAGGDAEARLVSCFDRHTGQLLWEKAVTDVPGTPSRLPNPTEDTGFSAPTMAVDGNHVYAIFATGDLIAFDLEGNRVWAVNPGLPENHYGHSSSLMVYRDKLVVQYDTGRGGRMLAVNIADGSTIWDVSRDNQISWSSPILIQKDNKMQIVTTADPYVAGHDLETGEELWRVEALMGEVAPSAAYADGVVFATNEYARTVAVKPEPGAEFLWEDNYYLSEVSSPVAYNGFLFLATSYGDLVCHDASNGELLWEKHFDNGFYSSPMIAEDRLYIIDMGGVMHILKADDSAEIINQPELGEKAYALPAFADGRIYIRSNNALFCIEEE
jgi:outer membrane protein assembly factor BamB